MESESPWYVAVKNNQEMEQRDLRWKSTTPCESPEKVTRLQQKCPLEVWKIFCGHTGSFFAASSVYHPSCALSMCE